MTFITKRRLARLASASALVAVLGVSAVAPVGAASVPKTTGDVDVDRTAEDAGIAHLVFVAQATSPAKGTFTYTDANGTYTIAVRDVEIDGPVAHFAGPIVSSTFTAPSLQVGQFIGIAVRDGGEPGIDKDRINGSGYATLEDAVAGYATLQPENLTASAGNLQVN